MKETIEIARPDMTDRCPTCAHNFGVHYTTYSGLIQGCSHTDPGARRDSPVRPCKCAGFVIAIRPDWRYVPPKNQLESGVLDGEVVTP